MMGIVVPKHVEQAIRSAIKNSVASSWHFISTYLLLLLLLLLLRTLQVRKHHFDAFFFIYALARSTFCPAFTD